MKLTIKGKNYTRFEIIELDVWGNKRDGFHINNLFATGVYITLPENWTDRQLVLALKRADAIKRNVRHTSVGIIDAGDDLICIEDVRDGRPCLQLHAR